MLRTSLSAFPIPGLTAASKLYFARPPRPPTLQRLMQRTTITLQTTTETNTPNKVWIWMWHELQTRCCWRWKNVLIVWTVVFAQVLLLNSLSKVFNVFLIASWTFLCTFPWGQSKSYLSSRLEAVARLPSGLKSFICSLDFSFARFLPWHPKKCASLARETGAQPSPGW